MATSNHSQPSSIAIAVYGGTVQVFVDSRNGPAHRVTLDAPRSNRRRSAAQRPSLFGIAPRHGLTSMLDRALPRAESSSADVAGGAFIATHSPFQVFVELAKVVGSARSEILIVDPYVNATALTDIAISAREGVQILILGDRAGTKSSLAPAASRWQAQYKASRPLEVRLARDKSLHDRLLLIDRSEVWNLSQSIADFAKKSPASIERSNAFIAKEKAAAYLGLWKSAASFF